MPRTTDNRKFEPQVRHPHHNTTCVGYEVIEESEDKDESQRVVREKVWKGSVHLEMCVTAPEQSNGLSAAAELEAYEEYWHPARA